MLSLGIMILNLRWHIVSTAGIPNLRHIYIQDPYAESIEQALLAVLPIDCRAKVNTEKIVDNFTYQVNFKFIHIKH